MARAKILITGGTGFVGSNILDALPPDVQCTVLSRSLPSIHEMKKGINYVSGDVRTFKFRSGIYSHVIHAAEAGPIGTKNVLRCKPERFLLISSGAAYYPGTEYADEKIASEILVRRANGKIARCFSFMGPHMQMTGRFAIGNFIRDAVIEHGIKIKGDGKAIRSYLYSTDMAAWLLGILQSGAPAATYNVGSHIPISMKNLAKEVALQVSKRIDHCVTIDIENGKPPCLAPHEYVPSIYQRNSGPDLKVKIGLKEAISKTLDWCLK